MKKEIVIVLGLLFLVGCGSVDQAEAPVGNDEVNTQPQPSNSETKGDSMIVVFETNKGNFEVELNKEKAPISVDNFVGYVNDGFYDGLIFHRVISGFMVQAGGFSEDMSQKDTKAPIKNEAENGLSNDKYTIAMARTAVVDSATAQFFINTADNTPLNHGVRDFGYAVFGKVTSGTDVIDAIEQVPTTSKAGHQDVPSEAVVITKAYVKE